MNFESFSCIAISVNFHLIGILAGVVCNVIFSARISVPLHDALL